MLEAFFLKVLTLATTNRLDVGIIRSEARLLVAAVLMAVATFTFDLFTPLGVAGGAPYTVLVLLGLWSRRASLLPILAGVATALTILGGLLSPQGEEIWKGIVNRNLTIMATWTIVLMLFYYRRTRTVLENTLRERQAYLDVIEVVLVVLDRQGKVQLLNRKGCEILGYSEGEVVGLNWFTNFSPKREAEKSEDVHRRLIAGEIKGLEYVENVVCTRDGQERLMAWHNTILRDNRGREVGTLSAGEDITERQAAEDAAREREALARIGQMAAMVAHEVRNPLAGIRGSVQILGRRLPSDGEEQEVIQTILERLDGMARMSQDLLLYSRPRVARFERLCLKELLHSSGWLLASDPEMERVEVEVSGADGEMDGDPELLANMFLNLLLNAAQAMQGEGVIQVGVVDGEGQWQVSVKDTGSGIPEEARARIFEPFFTTRHRGTGLGLAIAKQTVEAHGGTISLTCPPEGGTQVLVSFPRE